MTSFIDNDIPSNKELWLYYNEINPKQLLKC